MTNKDLRRLNRGELIEIIYQYRMKTDELTAENERLNKQLSERIIKIKEAGSIAEAALSLNKIFEAAQTAAEQYIASVKALKDNGGELPQADDDTAIKTVITESTEAEHTHEAKAIDISTDNVSDKAGEERKTSVESAASNEPETETAAKSKPEAGALPLEVSGKKVKRKATSKAKSDKKTKSDGDTNKKADAKADTGIKSETNPEAKHKTESKNKSETKPGFLASVFKKKDK